MTASPATTSDLALAEIERAGFTCTLVAEYDLTKLDPSRRIQVRESEHYAPKDMCQRFAVQMDEIAFPPIIVTHDDFLLDGNTRTGARKIRGDKFAPAYVLDVDYDSPRTTAKQKRLLKILAATLNSNGGKQLTSQERAAVVREMVAEDYKNEEIARTLGVTSATVGHIKREITAETKLARVGLDSDFVKTLPPASKRALGNSTTVGLNDVPFKALAELAVHAAFNASEINAAAKEAKETGSDTTAMDLLAKLRDENSTRIAEVARTGVGKPPLARQLRQHLGNVTKFQGREVELLETTRDDAVVADHIAALTTSIAVLTTVLKLQEAS